MQRHKKMRKQVWIIQCDICGKSENSKLQSGRYNDIEVSLPDGWGYGYNKSCHLCPDCFNAFLNAYKKEERHVGKREVKL